MVHSKLPKIELIRTLATLALSILVLFVWLGFNNLSDQFRKASVLSASDDVDVTATVGGCVLTITTRPERRIPPVNNWGTQLDVKIYNNNDDLVADLDMTSNFAGTATVNLCSNGEAIAAGQYDFHVRGLSHLRRVFDNVSAFTSFNTNVDLTNKLLLAGETSVVFNNYINSLDLSTQLRRLYTGDEKNDLNQDGLVNVLDLAITSDNLFLTGE